MRETQVWSLGREDPLQKEMATHSSITAWRIPWIEEPGRLQSMVWQSVGHDWDTSLQDNLPRFWSISGQFQYFPETESVSQFLQGCLYLCRPPCAPFSSAHWRCGGKWGYPSMVEGITFFPSLKKELFSKLVQLSSKCRKRSVCCCC